MNPTGYQHCYFDQNVPRSLNGTNFEDDTNMTNDICIAFCKGQGYAFAGTEYSRQCYCGNYLDMSQQKSESQCQYYCMGNHAENCGGSWALSVYGTGNGTGFVSNTAPASANQKRYTTMLDRKLMARRRVDYEE